MRNKIKSIIAVLLVVIMVLSCTATVFAETIYYYYGYLYTYVNNEKVSLYGVEEGTSELDIPDMLNNRAVVDISNYAFMDNSEITSVNFENASNLERIGSFAFKGSGISGEVVIPSSVVQIEPAAFEECSGLNTMTLLSNVSTISSQFCYGCSHLSSLNLNNNVETISSFAFANCPELSYVEIPTSVTSIRASAFDKDVITLGVYTNSYAHQFSEENGFTYILLDAPVPTEPPTEPKPTEVPTEAPTDEPPVPATEAPTEMPVKYLGDVDGDGTVTSIDATLIQRHLCYIKTMISDKMFMMGDVDGDGIITIIDVSFIMRYLATIEVPYPIGGNRSIITPLFKRSQT